MQREKTIKKNSTGGVNTRYEGSNPTPNTDGEIKKAYEEAKEGSAFYQPKKDK